MNKSWEPGRPTPAAPTSTARTQFFVSHPYMLTTPIYHSEALPGLSLLRRVRHEVSETHFICPGTPATQMEEDPVAERERNTWCTGGSQREALRIKSVRFLNTNIVESEFSPRIHGLILLSRGFKRVEISGHEDPEILERMRPIFEASGAPINFTGGVFIGYFGITESKRGRVLWEIPFVRPANR
ncbi:Light-independent protochlorophyllide reductase subunit N [Folsomia candida]|uniref:Light-independent protochlorophyllide reductase subunit N n=1 Tax=Folsomia candida TaxID=158441 RepID=A0A226DR41_FOLCA|nr:Light-independent protochlorophyllide reductase subunit N [Folsomia candida]